MPSPSNNASTVNSLYLAFYGRPADPAGLKFWTQQLDKAEGDLGAIAATFARSDETQARFGTSNAAERIGEIYQQLFNRTPDAEGMSYWLNAIDKGHAGIEDVAIAILNGSQGKDTTLVNIRQQAMETFTAQVEASGSDYDGYAAIEAARILVHAITLDTNANDISVLVKSTVDFASIATSTPGIVGAIASGGKLLDLFGTAHGRADPVTLVQAIADTAKAAATDPVTLGSLVREGGMTQVLKDMPAGASLKDFVKALADDGLAAAIEIVQPTPVRPPAPAPESLPLLKFGFKGVTQGVNDTQNDSVTNIAKVSVQFSYTGKDLAAGQYFEFSTDGVHWNRANISVSTTDNTVTVSDVDLTLGKAKPRPGNPSGIDNHQDNLYTMACLRAVGSDGAATAPFSYQIAYDRYANAPDAVLVHDSNFEGDRVTTNGMFELSSVNPGAIVEYQTEPVSGQGVPPGAVWTTEVPTMHEGVNSFFMRQTDAAGNVSEARKKTFTVDTEAPLAPVITLMQDSGPDTTDGITSIAKVAISGLETNLGWRWEFSIDGGLHWRGGRHIDSGEAVLDLLDYADGKFNVLVRQYDLAGHVSAESNALEFTYDRNVVAEGLTFYSVERPLFGRSGTDLDKADVYFRYGSADAAEVSFEYRLDGSDWTALDPSAYDSVSQILTVPKVDLIQADRTVEVRVIDAAGHAGAPVGEQIDSTFNNVAEKSTVVIIELNMSNSLSEISLHTSPHPIVDAGHETGLANPATLALEDLSTGTAAATLVDYTDGEDFHMDSSVLRLDSSLALDLYQLSWQDDTFLTAGPSRIGYVAEGSAMIVGGTSGGARVQGFVLDESVMLAGDIDEGSWDNDSTAFIDDGQASLRIDTGGGMDVISDNGGTLIIAHKAFDSAATDVVLGFDSGNDVIEFNGDAAVRIDDNGNGNVEWTTGSSDVVAAGSEAVMLITEGIISMGGSDTDIDLTLATLNDGLDLTGMQAGDELLILVRGSNHAALFYYQDINGDAVLDTDDFIVLIDVFDNGGIRDTDIQLVGSVVPTA